MNKLFADHPIQGNREFTFFYGQCVVLTSTVLVYIIPPFGFMLKGPVLAISIISLAIGFAVGREKWRRMIATGALACYFFDSVNLQAWILAFLLTCVIDAWQIRKRKKQLMGWEN